MIKKYEFNVFRGKDIMSYGIVGEETDNPHYRVGDIVAFVDDGEPNIGLIIKSMDSYGIMGWHADGLNGRLKIISVIKSYRTLTPEIYNAIVASDLVYTGYIKLEERSKVIKMTQEEIETKLGYPIEIVKEKELPWNF